MENILPILNSPIGLIALGVGALGVLLLAIAGLQHATKKAIENGTHPVIVQALMRGIFQAEKAAGELYEKTSLALTGLDKHRLAMELYDELPDTIQVGKLPPIPVKMLLPPEKFEDLLEAAFKMLVDGYGFIWRKAKEQLPKEVRILPVE